MDFPSEWNIIPIKEFDKKPLVNWKDFQENIYPKTDLEKHKGNYAVICGKISNNLLIIDFDFKENQKVHFKEIYEDYIKKYPDLAETYIVETKNGFHIYYYMEDFTEDRHPNKNLIYTDSKKKNKKIFRGLIKTNYAEYLSGWDILGNNGYALIPPSKLKDGEYKVFNEVEIKKINQNQFSKIKNFFLLEKTKEPRKPFIDILNGELEIESYSTKVGQKEFLYWKALFFEIWNYCRLNPSEIYPFLKENQPSFDEKTTEEQLKYDYNSPYKNHPFTNEKLKEMFPEYFQRTGFEIVMDTIFPKTQFNEKEIYERIEKINAETTNNNDILEILRKIPSGETGVINRAVEELSKRLNWYSKKDITNLIKKYTYDAGKLREVEKPTDEWSIEDFKKFAENDDINIGDINFTINYDNEYIIDSNKGLFLYTNNGEFKQTLNKPIKFIYRTTDIEKYNAELFTFEFNNYIYRNEGLVDILKILEPYTLRYSRFGRDVLKQYICYISDKIEYRNPEYILGWNNGWKLPLNENEKKMTIINHTENQSKIYNNIQEKQYKSYTDEEKTELKKKLFRFLEITEMNENKLAIIVGWSISAPFRSFFINKQQLFTFLCLCGFRQTGKSSVGEFFVSDFYKTMDTHLSATNLNSESRIEDYLASSSFPLNIQEVSEIKNNRVIDILKDSTTGTSKFVRKNTDNTIRICKDKVGAVLFDGNEPVEAFMDEAWNSKLIFLNFERSDTVKYNEEWMNLFDGLKRESLFSLIYDYTKDWTDADLEKQFKKIEEDYTELIDDLAHKDQRLAKTFKIIAFGISLFHDIFNISLNIDYAYDLLVEGRTHLSKDLLDIFLIFVDEAVELGRRLSNTDDRLRNLPNYLKHAIEENSKGECLFTQAHLKDFEKMSGLKLKSLLKLYNLLSESVDVDGILSYDSKYIKSEGKNRQCISVKRNNLA